MRCEISMSFKVNTSPRTPHPMGSTATCQAPRAMSYIDTSPALVSIVSKGAESTPLAPSDRMTSVCAAKIQLHQSRSTPQSHALMSSAIEPHAKCVGMRSAERSAKAAAKASMNRLLETRFPSFSIVIRAPRWCRRVRA